ncbi:uncharacterized protein LOC122723682 [Manihot esculenta]|uniref:uncharacterized protein LOC122723682 n=1 Tax=Manihot esculenta TaxID=3983 RepID=UPI001CC6D41B|nr:uncharacterized protein LOC122723682 [Manihot esculenta]
MEPNVVTVFISALPATPYAKLFPDISKIEDINRRELKATKSKELATRANLGLFVLNISAITNGNASFCAFLLNSFDLWHARLGHKEAIKTEIDSITQNVCKSKAFIASKFDMKDMGEANMILGVRIIRKNDSLMLSQEHYVEKFLRKFGHFNVKSVSTPYDPNCQLKKNRGDSVAQSEYAQIIGSLLYLMNFSPTPSVSMRSDCQPAIAIAKNKTFNGKNRHIRLRHNAIKQLLKYETIFIDYVKSEVNLADPLTKPVTAQKPNCYRH